MPSSTYMANISTSQNLVLDPSMVRVRVRVLIYCKAKNGLTKDNIVFIKCSVHNNQFLLKKNEYHKY